MKFVCLHGADDRLCYIEPSRILMFVYSKYGGTSVALSETHFVRVTETPEEICKLLAGGVQSD